MPKFEISLISVVPLHSINGNPLILWSTPHRGPRPQIGGSEVIEGPPVWMGGGPTDPPRTRDLRSSIFADASPQRRTASGLASISRPECLQTLGNEARCKRNEKFSPAAPSIGVFPYPGDNIDHKIGLKRVQFLHDLLSNLNGSGQTAIFTITPMVNGRDAFRKRFYRCFAVASPCIFVMVGFLYCNCPIAHL